VETFLSDSKGRGLRSTRSVVRGQVLLIQQPIASVEASFKKDKFIVTRQATM
jgi:hypothetical protein